MGLTSIVEIFVRQVCGAIFERRTAIPELYFRLQSVLGKGRRWRGTFPQGKFGHPTLTEKIHSYRIAASERPECSMVRSHDESTR